MTERRSWAEIEECIDELYRRMDRVDPPDDYPSMAEQYRRAERWKRIEAAAMRVAGSSASNHVVTTTRNGVEVMAELIQALQS